MQVTHLDNEQTAEVISESKVLTILEWPGANRTFVIEANRRDCLLIRDSDTGESVLIDRCIYDRDSDGSVHDHARSIYGQSCS